ncbi:hypothetical protein CW713_08730 [Methanophagales archaeon]|nr:MAG: hypothetical protein CW713_08730 [Methanophagales archaeon]
MIYNAMNITNLTSNAHTIASWVLQWWRLLVGIGIPSGVVIMYRVLAKALYDIEIIECNNGYTCKYKTTSWLNSRLVRIYLWLYRAWGLWKQIETTKNRYNTKYKAARKELAQILFHDVWSKVSFNISSWDGSGDIPSNNWYLAEHWVNEGTEYDLIDAIIKCEGDNKRYPLLEVNKPDGKFILQVFRTYIAGTDTESKREELMNLILSVWDADKTKDLVIEVNDAKRNAEEAEEAFKEKLARIVNHVRFWNDVFSLRSKR